MICFTKEEVSILQERNEKMMNRISVCYNRIKEALKKLAKSDTVKEAKRLLESLFAKLERLPTLGHDQLLSHPFLGERRGNFKLVGVAPMIGKKLTPPLLFRIIQPITKQLVEIKGWNGVYDGVYANISYVSRHPQPVRYFMLRQVRYAPCAIKTFSVLFWDDKNNAFSTGTGTLHLKRDAGDQVFEVPSFVETRAIRIVVQENWGNTTNTCFDGMRFYQV